MNDIIRLDESQVEIASNVLARAFQDDPLMKLSYPDETHRFDNLPRFFRVFLRHGIDYGEVYSTSPDLGGIAIWLPSENVDISLSRMMRFGGVP